MAKEFKYIDTATRILEDLCGKLAPGELLPFVPELRERYGVSEITIKKALSLLVERGIVKRTQKKGTELLRRYDGTTDRPSIAQKTIRVLTLNDDWAFSDYIENVLRRYRELNAGVSYQLDRVGNLYNYPESLRAKQYDLALVGTRLTGQMTLNPALEDGFEAIDGIPGLWFGQDSLFDGVTRWCRGKRGLMCLPFYFLTVQDRVNLDYPCGDKDTFGGGMPLERYLEMLRRVVRGRDGLPPAPFFFRLESCWLLAIHLMGGRLFSTDFRKCVINSPETREGLQLILDMVHRDKLCPPPGFEESLWGDELFKTGKFLRIWVPCGANPDRGYGFRNRFVPLPTGRKALTMLTWAGAMVPKGAQLDIVRDFLNFTRLPENARAMTASCPGIPCDRISGEEHVRQMERRVEGFPLFLSSLDCAEPLDHAPDPMLLDKVRRSLTPVFLGMETPEQACAKIERECDAALNDIFAAGTGVRTSPINCLHDSSMQTNGNLGSSGRQ